MRSDPCLRTKHAERLRSSPKTWKSDHRFHPDINRRQMAISPRPGRYKAARGTGQQPQSKARSGL